jgi:Macrocin-O-methyltransferase (TylF)
MNPNNFVKGVVPRLISQIGYKITKIPSMKIKGKRQDIRVNYKWLIHFLYFKEMFDLIADRKGDIVECGVGRGSSFFKLCCLACSENKSRKVYGFDSFEGFPEPSEEDIGPRNLQKGKWNVSTVELMYDFLTEVGKIERCFVVNNVILVKGFFDESFQKYDGDAVAFLHLDVVLYNSYKLVLEYFWPKVTKGGVVLFDEYKNVSREFPGANKAIDEFFGDLRGEIQFNKQANRYYIVKR